MATISEVIKEIKTTGFYIKEDLSLEEIQAKYYPELDLEAFKTIIKIDPTTKEDKMGKYSKWLLNLFKKGTDVTKEAQELKDQLEIFDANKHKHNQEDRDIGKIKSLEELIELNHSYEAQVEKSEYELKAEQVPGVKVIGSTSNWEVYVPTTYEASKYLRGQNAVWCTGRHNDDHYWKSYTRDGGLLYIFINKQDRDKKYQGAIRDKECSEFRDARNGWIDLEVFLGEDPELLSLVEKDSVLKNVTQVKDARAIAEYKEGKPFIYEKGREVPKKIKGAITKVEFKSNELIDGLFEECTSLEEVKLPDGTKVIPDSCFSQCVKLTKVELPDSVEAIGAVAFYGCTSLKEINFPQSLTSVGIQAFKQCDKVKIRAKKGLKLTVKRLDSEFLRSHIKWEESK